MMRFLNSISILAIGCALLITGCSDAAKPVKVEKVPQSSSSQNSRVDAHGHEDSAERISVEEAKKDFDAGDAVFLDTRDPRAFAQEHILGAINIPETEVDARFNTIPKGKKLIAYCS